MTRRAHPSYYLAYGSNLNVIQMQQRCKDAMPVLRCNLLDQRLVFSGVLNVEPYPGATVPAALWHVSTRDIAALDRYEGFPRLYTKRFSHAMLDGERVEVFYYAMRPEMSDERLPSRYYFAVCLEGYSDWGIDRFSLDDARERAYQSELEWLDERGALAALDEDDQGGTS